MARTNASATAESTESTRKAAPGERRALVSEPLPLAEVALENGKGVQTRVKNNPVFPQRPKSASLILPFRSNIFKIAYRISRGVEGIFLYSDFLKTLWSREGPEEEKKKASPFPGPSSSAGINPARQVHGGVEGLTFFLCSLSMRPLL